MYMDGVVFDSADYAFSEEIDKLSPHKEHIRDLKIELVIFFS
jgi:hypothetical protein